MKLLLSDLDGTLLTRKKQLVPEVQEAIDLWQRRGNLFVIATGRLISSAQFFADNSGTGDVVVACSGATIYREGNLVYQKSIPLYLAQRLWEILAPTGEYCQVYCDRSLVYNREEGLLGGYKLHENYAQKYRLPLILMEDFDSGLLPGAIHKLSFVCHDPQRAREIIAQLGDLSSVNVFRSLPFLYDIISKEADKGIAGLWLKDLLKAEHFYAIGDNENDVAMLEQAEISAAMKDAPEGVAKKADLIVSSSEEDGVAEFIYYLLDKTD
ncbi:MAG: HAD family phosphatase [Tissierellia bacterium]|nr:HAD family phosphatase [Tissierellia bacterium]